CAAALANLDIFRRERTIDQLQDKIAYLYEEKIGIKVIQEARRLGLIIRPLDNVIVLMPPLSVSRVELGRMLDITFDSIKKVTE
ncbi:MAG: bioA, partial [Dehalococcoidia bacterium]|nr:bioA [Dehalococcoidia bacterium]